MRWCVLIFAAMMIGGCISQTGKLDDKVPFWIPTFIPPNPNTTIPVNGDENNQASPGPGPGGLNWPLVIRR